MKGRTVANRQEAKATVRPLLLTQKQLAVALNVSARYIRDTPGIPCVYLPGNGPAGRRVKRYELAAVLEWLRLHNPGFQTSTD